MDIVQGAESLFEQLISWRRHLHRNPELSFEEFNTANFIISELEKLEHITVDSYIGGYGIIATLSSGEGPTIAIRADMDALPIHEENTHDFVSQNEGVMHACGHDAHVSMALGAVHLLHQQLVDGKLKGTVKFIFQPAEETTDENGLSGAPRMIQAGALDGIDAIVALHVCPWQPVGAVQMNNGFSMANVDVFEGTIRGTGGHGGYPHLSTDPMWMLGNFLQNFYGMVSRKISPLEIVAASIGKIEAGSASNIIPAEVYIEGTLRTYSPEVRDQLAEEVENVFKIVESFGGSYDLYIERGEPALNNNMEINVLIDQAIHDIYPDFHVHWEPFGLGVEDFGYMTEEIPGAMFFLGCQTEDKVKKDLHTPIFDIDERCLPIGTAIFVATVNQFFQRENDYTEPTKRSSYLEGA